MESSAQIVVEADDPIQGVQHWTSSRLSEKRFCDMSPEERLGGVRFGYLLPFLLTISIGMFQFGKCSSQFNFAG